MRHERKLTVSPSAICSVLDAVDVPGPVSTLFPNTCCPPTIYEAVPYVAPEFGNVIAHSISYSPVSGAVNVASVAGVDVTFPDHSPLIVATPIPPSRGTRPRGPG